MEGTIFLWLMWSYWVIFTFFMPKSLTRFWLSVAVLLMILLSDTYVSVFDLKVNIVFFVLIITGCYLFDIPKRRQIPYYALSTLIISMAYSLIYIYLLYDPAIRLVINPWVFFVGIVILNRLLVKPFKLKIATLLLGMLHGEILRVLLLFDPQYLDILGDGEFLDHLTFTTTVSITFTGFEMLTGFLQTLVQRPSGGKIQK